MNSSIQSYAVEFTGKYAAKAVFDTHRGRVRSAGNILKWAVGKPAHVLFGWLDRHCARVTIINKADIVR